MRSSTQNALALVLAIASCDAGTVSQEHRDGGGNQGGGSGGASGDGGGGSGGGGPAGDWSIDDQIATKKTLGLNNGEFDFLFAEVTKSASPFPGDQTLLTAKISARSGSTYSMAFSFNMFVGINQVGSDVFYAFAGLMTGHKVEDLSPDGKRVTFEYDKPYDGFKMDRPSTILSPARLVFTIRWKNARVDIDQLRSVKAGFGVHNGFRSHILDIGYPFAIRMGVDSSEARWSMSLTGPPGGEDVIGYFVREDGKLGIYDRGAASGSATWLDYYALEKGDRATLVYQPDFRNLALKKTYAGGFYANVIRPSTFSAGVQPTYAQTGYGGAVNYVQIAAGSYDERIRLLLGQPKASDPAAYKDLVAGLK